MPSAVVNYLLLLGWHPGNNQEIFSLPEATKAFNLEGLNASGAVYNIEKLNWYNNYYIQKLELEENEFFEYAWQTLKKEYNLTEEKKEWVKQISLLFRSQLNYFAELTNLTYYFFQEPNREKAEIKKNEILWGEELKKALNKLEKWEIENIKLALKSVCINSQAPKKEFYLSIRKILTGTDKGPELPQIIYLLNKKETEERLKNYT